MESRTIVGIGLLWAGLHSGSNASAQCPAEELEKISPHRPHFGDIFPWAMDLEEDRALVGVLRSSLPSGGVAFVLGRSGDRWRPTATLQPANPAIMGFGLPVAIDGAFAAVGAAELASDGFFHERVDLFQQFGPSWIEIDVLSSPTPAVLDRFGSALDLDGDLLVVGASCDDEQANDAGAAFVYRFEGSAWILEQKLFAPVTGRGFGRSVDVDGDRLLVGDFAAAWAFAWNGSSWVDDGSLVGADVDASQNENYADVLALSGDRAIVGARFHSHGSSFRGGAWIFVRTPTGWVEEIHVLPDPASTNAQFGHQVAIDGALALVSENAGAAYLYSLDASGWTLADRPYGSDSDGQTGAFGSSLAFDGANALIGCMNCDFVGCGQFGCHSDGAIYAFEICAKATLESRNGGQNPTSLSGTPARIGERFELRVNLATTGHALALPFAFEAQVELPMHGGQVVLAADRGLGALLQVFPRAGPLAVFELPGPADVGLIGFAFSVQALHFGGRTPFALSNALDFVVGEF